MRFCVTISQRSSEYKKMTTFKQKTTINRSNIRLNLSLRILIIAALREFSKG